MAKNKGFFGRLRRIFNPKWFGLDFCKITAGPSFPLVFRTKRYFEKPGMKKRHLKGRGIIISNHTCFWDPVVIVSEFYTRRVRFLISKGLHDFNGLLAFLLDAAGCIVVDKEHFTLDCISEMVQTLEDDGVVGIFPEGQISDTGELLPFKEGVVMVALRSRAPIIPMVMMGDEKLSRRRAVLYGQPIVLHELCGDGLPGMQQVEEMGRLLHERMAALQAQLEQLEHERLERKAARGRRGARGHKTAEGTAARGR